MKRLSKLVTICLLALLVSLSFIACSQKTHTVTFKDGDTVIIEIIVPDGGKIYKIEEPKKEGLIFIEWQLLGENKAYNFDTPVTKNLVLVAKFDNIIVDNGFQFNSKSGTIVDYITPTEEVVIPSKIRGFDVITLGEKLFMDNTTIKSITIPMSVKDIKFSLFENCTALTTVNFDPAAEILFGINIFKGCTALKRISLPQTITSIGTSMFEDCTSLNEIVNIDKALMFGVNAFKGCSSLTEVNLLKAMQLDTSAFENCTSLTSITLAPSLIKLGEKAFKNCLSLTSLTIPKSVSTIRINTFDGCDKLSTLTVDTDSTYFSAQENAIYNKAKTKLLFVCNGITTFQILASVTSIEQTAFASCSQLLSITVEPQSKSYVAENGVLYTTNHKNLALVPAQYAGEVKIYATTNFFESNAMTKAQKVTKIVIEENNPVFKEIDHIIYRYYGNSFTLVTANRDFSGKAVVLAGNESYNLSTITDGAFAFCKLSAIDFAVKTHANIRMTKQTLADAPTNFKINASKTWEIEISGNGKWEDIMDTVVWVEPAL